MDSEKRGGDHQLGKIYTRILIVVIPMSSPQMTRILGRFCLLINDRIKIIYYKRDHEVFNSLLGLGLAELLNIIDATIHLQEKSMSMIFCRSLLSLLVISLILVVGSVSSSINAMAASATGQISGCNSSLV